MCRTIIKEAGEQDKSADIGLHPNGLNNVKQTWPAEDIVLSGNIRQCQGDLACLNEVTKRGMCDKHYRRWWRANSNKGTEYEKSYYVNVLKPIRQLSNKPKEKVCLRCGKTFTKTGQNQKFCSKTCENTISHKRKRKNPEFKLIHNVRSRLRKALVGIGRDKRIFILLGCSGLELRNHLESKFQPGMTWENYGEWHMDHIKPLASFNLSNSEQLKEACHYTNLQPLWAIDNIRKANNLV